MQEDLNKNMKAKILIIDLILIISTLVIMNYYNHSMNYGLAALEDAGKVLICLILLGIELLTAIIVFLIWVFSKIKKK